MEVFWQTLCAELIVATVAAIVVIGVYKLEVRSNRRTQAFFGLYDSLSKLRTEETFCSAELTQDALATFTASMGQVQILEAQRPNSYRFLPPFLSSKRRAMDAFTRVHFKDLKAAELSDTILRTFDDLPKNHKSSMWLRYEERQLSALVREHRRKQKGLKNEQSADLPSWKSVREHAMHLSFLLAGWELGELDSAHMRRRVELITSARIGDSEGLPIPVGFHPYQLLDVGPAKTKS